MCDGFNLGGAASGWRGPLRLSRICCCLVAVEIRRLALSALGGLESVSDDVKDIVCISMSSASGLMFPPSR